MKTTFYVEFYGKQINEEFLLNEAKKVWEAAGKKASAFGEATLYVKPEDNQVYCVFSDDSTGCFPLD